MFKRFLAFMLMLVLVADPRLGEAFQPGDRPIPPGLSNVCAQAAMAQAGDVEPQEQSGASTARLDHLAGAIWNQTRRGFLTVIGLGWLLGTPRLAAQEYYAPPPPIDALIETLRNSNREREWPAAREQLATFMMHFGGTVQEAGGEFSTAIFDKVPGDRNLLYNLTLIDAELGPLGRSSITSIIPDAFNHIAAAARFWTQLVNFAHIALNPAEQSGASSEDVERYALWRRTEARDFLLHPGSVPANDRDTVTLRFLVAIHQAALGMVLQDLPVFASTWRQDWPLILTGVARAGGADPLLRSLPENRARQALERQPALRRLLFGAIDHMTPLWIQSAASQMLMDNWYDHERMSNWMADALKLAQLEVFGIITVEQDEEEVRAIRGRVLQVLGMSAPPGRWVDLVESIQKCLPDLTPNQSFERFLAELRKSFSGEPGDPGARFAAYAA